MRLNLIILSIFTLLPTPLLAADPTWVDTLLVDIFGLLPQVTALLTGIALLVFVWGLTVFIRNTGDEKKLDEGKKLMVWGVVALFVIVSVWGIVALLQTMTGTTGGTPQPTPQVTNPF